MLNRRLYLQKSRPPRHDLLSAMLNPVPRRLKKSRPPSKNNKFFLAFVLLAFAAGVIYREAGLLRKYWDALHKALAPTKFGAGQRQSQGDAGPGAGADVSADRRPSLKPLKLNHTHIPPAGGVHDPKFLLRNPRPFRISPDERAYVCASPGKAAELPRGARALARIRRHIEISTERRNVTLMCAVYTYGGAVAKTDAVRDTWGRRCDGLLLASSETNATTGHTRLPSASSHGFAYKGMVQRTRAILAYLYDHFLGEFDFFHISGDDVFVIVENLKEFLASERAREWNRHPDQYLIAGFWSHWGKMAEGYFYLGGGSGYTLSGKALKAYVEGPLQTCRPTLEGSAEDIWFSDCARELSPRFIDTRDPGGAHRYHQMPVQQHASSRTKHLGFLMRTVHESIAHMERNFSFPYVAGAASIASSSVTFHRHPPREQRRLELLLYLDRDAVCGAQFRYAAAP